MTTYNTAVNDLNQAGEIFNRLSTDDKLAFLWFVYTQMGEQITPAAPDAASPDISQGLFNQVKEKSQQEQLQIQREIVNRANTQISREYGSLSANTKLAFWYLLARGMDEGSIIPMPDQYELPSEGRDLLAATETMEFEQQITFLRDAVVGMGAEPAAGAKI